MSRIEEGVRKLDAALADTEALGAAVRCFYDDVEVFAGRTFLEMPSDPHRIETFDLLAVTLMGEMFRPLAIRQLLAGEVGEEAHHLLQRLDPDEALWNLDIEALHRKGHPVFDLWWLLMDLDEVGPTRASKLMARKRPNIVPIYDSVIGDRIATVDDYWRVFHLFLSDDERCAKVEELRATASLSDIPLLRILDTAIWMRYSGGRSARRVRKACGLGDQP
ncbi:MAG: DUF6308 family protein [Actinobacteria bacterium]|nr:DUF6308 family protein [Actinomycetota bacterium]